ncbi:MAG: DUF305 domain-containing protein, partial [Actinobacteria bacterium]|nr:DUF305 domain-containing protein [Actinomycetota bacterium]
MRKGLTLSNTKRHKKLRALLAGFALLFALTACGNDATSSSQSKANSSDAMFVQMMIPHHEQAIAMSTMAKNNTKDVQVLALARDISAAQLPEIDLMQQWLIDQVLPSKSHSGDSDMNHSMGHGMSDDGMLNQSQMTALSKARNDDFDRLYLRGMIEHHKGAIDMA